VSLLLNSRFDFSPPLWRGNLAEQPLGFANVAVLDMSSRLAVGVVPALFLRGHLTLRFRQLLLDPGLAGSPDGTLLGLSQHIECLLVALLLKQLTTLIVQNSGLFLLLNSGLYLSLTFR
jgi:hypothetical protein